MCGPGRANLNIYYRIRDSLKAEEIYFVLIPRTIPTNFILKTVEKSIIYVSSLPNSRNACYYYIMYVASYSVLFVVLMTRTLTGF